MIVHFITEPIPSAMGKGKGGFRGKLVEQSARSFEEIAEAVARDIGGSTHHVQAIFTAFMEEILKDAYTTGNNQNLGDYGVFALKLRGGFKGIDDSFDPERHTLTLNFVTGRKFKNRAAAFKPVNRVQPPCVYLTSICGEVTKVSGRWFMTWQADTTCNGCNVKMVPGDTVTWACTLADGSVRSGPCEVYNNAVNMLDFRWPEGIPAEAIGREITLTFNLRGGRADGTPISLVRKVPLEPKGQ